MYNSHPSAALNALFANKPYQGVAPELAAFLFIGLDANYGSQIEHQPIFSKICEYHSDGVAFWRQYGVHHPFLLPEYSGDGQFYHRSFARIGFQPAHATLISFAELLHVPTVGRNNIAVSVLDEQHLRNLNNAILNGAPSHIFLPKTVALLMKKSNAFPWLKNVSIDNNESLPVLFQCDGKTVYSHLHFSVYGKFQDRKVAQATAIQKVLISSS